MGLTQSLPFSNGLGLLPYVAMTVIALSVGKSWSSTSSIWEIQSQAFITEIDTRLFVFLQDINLLDFT